MATGVEGHCGIHHLIPERHDKKASQADFRKKADRAEAFIDAVSARIRVEAVDSIEISRKAAGLFL